MNRQTQPLLTFVFDWFLALLCLALFLIIEYGPIHPVDRDFNVLDLSISHPMRKETVSTAVLIVISLIIPLAILMVLLLSSLTNRVSNQIHAALDFNVAFLGLFQSWAASSLLVDFIKAVVGSLRPDFLARCVPDVTGLCTGDASLIREGRRSFPSLHSSMCTAGLCYLSFYIAGRLRPFRGDSYFWKVIITLAPSVVALYIGLTRVADNQHHPVDVFFGFLIGVLFAWGAYKLHYPSLNDHNAGIPLYIIKYRSGEHHDEESMSIKTEQRNKL